MVTRKMFQEIQFLKSKGFSKADIVNKTGLDWRTVRKYFSMEAKQFQGYLAKLRYRGSCFEPFKGEILDCFQRARQASLQKSSVYDLLEEIHGQLPASERAFRHYLEFLVETGELSLSGAARMYRPVEELPMGRQFQVDFGEYSIGEGLKLYLFGSVLSASRFKYVALQDQPFTTRQVISHLLDAFQAFGGIPQEMVIDQDHLLVVSENAGDIIFTKDFSHFISEMNLKMFVCRKADPESKGKVENLIKFVKRNFLASRSFATLDEARERLRKWLNRRANGRESSATRRVPAVHIEEERKHLRSLRASIFQSPQEIQREPRLVSKMGLISIGSTKYPVPDEYRQKTVDIAIQGDRIQVFDQKTGGHICECKKTLLPGGIARNSLKTKRPKLDALFEEMLALYQMVEWKDFLTKNREAFPRYFRDQINLYRRRFSSPPQTELFRLALGACLAQKSFSMTDLHDTYGYLHREQEPAVALVKTVTHEPPRVKIKAPGVASRNLQAYQEILRRGVNQ